MLVQHIKEHLCLRDAISIRVMNDKKGKETGAAYSRVKKAKHCVIYLTSCPSSNKITPKDISVYGSQNVYRMTWKPLKYWGKPQFLMYFIHYDQYWSVLRNFIFSVGITQILDSSVCKCSSDAIYRLNGDELKYPNIQAWHSNSYKLKVLLNT